MARIKVVEPEQASPDIKEIYDKKLGGKPANVRNPKIDCRREGADPSEKTQFVPALRTDPDGYALCFQWKAA